jgi:hypothetical protein
MKAFWSRPSSSVRFLFGIQTMRMFLSNWLGPNGYLLAGVAIAAVAGNVPPPCRPTDANSERMLREVKTLVSGHTQAAIATRRQVGLIELQSEPLSVSNSGHCSRAIAELNRVHRTPGRHRSVHLVQTGNRWFVSDPDWPRPKSTPSAISVMDSTARVLGTWLSR